MEIGGGSTLTGGLNRAELATVRLGQSPFQYLFQIIDTRFCTQKLRIIIRIIWGATRIQRGIKRPLRLPFCREQLGQKTGLPVDSEFSYCEKPLT